MNYKLISKKDYDFYVNSLIASTFSILPLYEEKNAFIYSYVKDIIEELECFKNLLNLNEKEEFSELYIKVLLNLEVLKTSILIENNHKKVKKKTLFITNTLQNHLKSLGDI